MTNSLSRHSKRQVRKPVVSQRMWRVFWQMCNWQWHLLSNRADSFLSIYVQAQRARSLGAIVYCVGVKDFNQTQVTWQHCTISCFSSDFTHNFCTGGVSVNLYCITCLAGHNCRHHRACVPSTWRIPGSWRNDRLRKFLCFSLCPWVHIQVRILVATAEF